MALLSEAAGALQKEAAQELRLLLPVLLFKFAARLLEGLGLKTCPGVHAPGYIWVPRGTHRVADVLWWIPLRSRVVLTLWGHPLLHSHEGVSLWCGHGYCVFRLFLFLRHIQNRSA